MNSDILLQQADRAARVRRGKYLEYFTIGYNSLEGLIAVGAGLMAGSIALVGFGFDSLIEVTSGSILLWRLHADLMKRDGNESKQLAFD
jgi:divalent metal cation (Fe/Co/Zn/Cd) transporter